MLLKIGSDVPISFQKIPGLSGWMYFPLISQILFQLLYVRGHGLWISNHLVSKHLMAVDFNDIPVKQDQGLGVHGHVVYAHIGSPKAVWKADHHNACMGES